VVAYPNVLSLDFVAMKRRLLILEAQWQQHSFPTPLSWDAPAPTAASTMRTAVVRIVIAMGIFEKNTGNPPRISDSDAAATASNPGLGAAKAGSSDHPARKVIRALNRICVLENVWFSM
jgi:hypothetical protein